MDIDEDDDFYSPEESDAPVASVPNTAAPPVAAPQNDQQEDLEEGEEEDEGGAMDEDEDDSDIDIITERKDGAKPTAPATSKYSEIRNIPQRTTSGDGTVKTAPAKRTEPKTPAGPPVSTSQVDINANPIHKETGKPLTQVNIDEDLPENDKPWRTPGTDLSDYFNYGFDEFTWTLYAQKQEALRNEYNQDAVTQSQKKMMEDFNQMMAMGGMPGLNMAGGASGGGGGGAGGNMGGMPGMDGMPPEMQQIMQQMMASGIDPTQMDPSAMAAMFGGGMPNQGGQGGQGQNFGGGNYGGGQNQGYGYDQQNMGNQGRGGFGGRGRGQRRNW